MDNTHPRSTPCFAKRMLVPTSVGIMTMGELNKEINPTIDYASCPNSSVDFYDENGTHSIESIQKEGLRSLYRITSANGYFIEATWNTCLVVGAPGGKTSVKRIEDIKEGDLVAMAGPANPYSKAYGEQEKKKAVSNLFSTAVVKEMKRGNIDVVSIGIDECNRATMNLPLRDSCDASSWHTILLMQFGIQSSASKNELEFAGVHLRHLLDSTEIVEKLASSGVYADLSIIDVLTREDGWKELRQETFSTVKTVEGIGRQPVYSITPGRGNGKLIVNGFYAYAEGL